MPKSKKSNPSLFFRISRKISQIARISDELELIRDGLGRIEARQSKDYSRLQDAEFRVSSQWGEDGILEYLISNLELTEGKFVEFGVENYLQSNTRFLLKNRNWQGLVIDGDHHNIEFVKRDKISWSNSLTAISRFIDCDNIQSLIANNIGTDIDLLSIDLDGNDYWIWDAIKNTQPKIVVCEYNSLWGSVDAVTIPYQSDFNRYDQHYSGLYYGASIQALVALGSSKGYTLVGGNSAGNNLFFIRNDLAGKFEKTCAKDAYKVNKFRESKNPDGSLSYLEPHSARMLIKEKQLIDIKNDRTLTVAEVQIG